MDGLGLFIGQFLRRPGEIRSLVPSSRALGRRVAAPLSRATGLVVELGPGTGTITRCLLDRGIPPERLVLMEMNAAFCQRLGRDFPGARVVNAAAQSLAQIPLAEAPGAVVSGIPLLAMSPHVQRAILAAAFARLRPGAPFLQLTYGLRPPVAPGLLDELGLGWERLGRVWRNLPPAEVYRFTRRA